MSNIDLENRVKELEAQIQGATIDLKAGGLTSRETTELQTSIATLALQKQKVLWSCEKLSVVSPIAGRVITPNVHDRLIKRYVKKGEVLLTLALPGQPSTMALPSGNATWTSGGQSMPPSVGILTRRLDSQTQHDNLLAQQRRQTWVQQYQQIAASTEPDRDQKLEALTTEIRTELTKTFDEKQAQNSERIANLEQRLAALKTSVEKQNKIRELVIKEQLEGITGAPAKD